MMIASRNSEQLESVNEYHQVQNQGSKIKLHWPSQSINFYGHLENLEEESKSNGRSSVDVSMISEMSRMRPMYSPVKPPRAQRVGAAQSS